MLACCNLSSKLNAHAAVKYSLLLCPRIYVTDSKMVGSEGELFIWEYGVVWCV